jgi:hypothetical protein
MFRGDVLACVVLAWSLVACSPDVGIDGLADTEARPYSYVDANPDSPLSSAEQAGVQRALGLLDRAATEGDSPWRRDLAAATLERIEAGAVLIGSIAGARGLDRWHMCKDFGLDACLGSFGGESDWQGDDALAETLADGLDGYQWGNRLYFGDPAAMAGEQLASTLVHEVNHVANRSECSYYSDIDGHVLADELAYVEEYRAFFSECLYTEQADDTAGCDGFSATHVDDYGFAVDSEAWDGGAGTLSLANKILAGEAGQLVPSAASWPKSFKPCGD